jgi:predicted dehydrogenase
MSGWESAAAPGGRSGGWRGGGCGERVLAGTDVPGLAVTDFEHAYTDSGWAHRLTIGHEHTCVHAIADFLSGVEPGTPAEPTFRTALQTQKVCDAILQSAKTGRWVETGSAGRRQRK